MAEKVRQDPRVTVLERTNLRNLRVPDIGGSHVDLVTLDLSFISGGWLLSFSLLCPPMITLGAATWIE